MKQGATGFLKIKIDDVIKIDEVSSIVFTVTTPDRDLQFKKSYPDDVAYEDGYYYVPLFQQDTVNMEGVYKIEAQINMKNAEVVKTTINKLFINSSLHTTMLDSNPSFRQIGSLVDMKVEGFAIGRDGENGATFTPIMTGTVLSWKNDKGYENPQPVDLKGAPYEESQEFKDYYKQVLSVVKQAENVSSEIDTKQETFNNNYESKVQETDKYFDNKKTQALTTLNQYVEDEKVNMQKFVAAEQEKYNQNAADKTNKFNNNAENKTNDFNSNASTKTSTFNENYIQKSSDFNSSVETAKNEIAEQKQSSILDIENKTEYGKNVINSNKNSALADINDKRVEAIEEVEQKAKSYQVQIDEIKEVNKTQDKDIEYIKATVDTKLTQPYINNNDSTHITTSDNGLMSDLVIKGNTMQETTKGYQLFYLPDDTKISNGVTTTIKDGLISCKGTVTVNGWFDICRKLNISLKQGVEYTFGINKALSVRCALKTFDNELGIDRIIEVGKTSVQFTPKSDISSAYIWIDTQIGTNIDIQFMIQVEKGSTAHYYEPYTGGQPSPNPDYPQEVKGISEISGKVVGKNLFDINKIKEISGAIKRNDDGSLTITSTSTDSSVATKMPLKDLADLEIGKTYIISFITTGRKQIYLNEAKQYWMSDSTLTITQDMLNSNVCLYPKGTSSTDIVSGIQIEEASTATNYQPYQSQSLNYTLSNPLYRLSDTIYDYIDLNKGKIIRNVGVVTFDGSDDEEISKVSNTNINVYQFIRAINSIEEPEKYTKCDRFQTAMSYNNDLLKNDNKIYTASISCYLSFDKMNTVEKLRVYLQQNPTTAYYRLATPTEEDIPTDLLNQLQQLKTYYPQTNIIWNTEVEPYINFDYKLNLPAWLEDKDNKDIIYDKKIETNQKALENQLTSEELDNQSIIDIDYRVTCLELDMEEQ